MQVVQKQQKSHSACRNFRTAIQKQNYDYHPRKSIPLHAGSFQKHPDIGKQENEKAGARVNLPMAHLDDTGFFKMLSEYPFGNQSTHEPADDRGNQQKDQHGGGDIGRNCCNVFLAHCLADLGQEALTIHK